MGRATKYNNITSPELISSINPENSRLKEEFLQYLRSTQRSEGTIAGYASDLDIFFVWNAQKNYNKFFVDIRKRDIIYFQNWLLNENCNSPARIRRLKASLSSLANYVENILDDEYPQFRNIINKIENPVNKPVREKTVLEEEQLKALLDHLISKGKYMQACMVSLAASSGARKSELTRFKLSYFSSENLICEGALRKTPEKIKTKGRGLGKYIYKYTLVSQFKPYLDLWIAERNKLGIKSDWLFPSSDPSIPISTNAMDGWTISYSRILGVPFYWHSLRHYFTTHLSKCGIPDGVIVNIVGWDSADMCSVYKDIDADDEISSWFGAEGIKDKSGSLNDL